MTHPLQLFIAYSHEDIRFADALKKHLEPLRRAGLVKVWYDREIKAGSHWQNEIHRMLEDVDAFLLLLSADFFASDYSVEVEMKRAIERGTENEGKATVIPVLIRTVSSWEETGLGGFQAVPSVDGRLRAVNKWSDEEDAWCIVADHVKSLAKRKTLEDRPSRASRAASKLADRHQQEMSIFDNRPEDVARSPPEVSVLTAQPAREEPAQTEQPYELADTAHTLVERTGSSELRWWERLAEALASWDLARCEELVKDPATSFDDECAQAWHAFSAQPDSSKLILGLIRSVSQGLVDSGSSRSAILRADLEALASRILLNDRMESRRHLEAAQLLNTDGHRVSAATSAYWRQYGDSEKASEFARASVRQAKDQPEGYIELGMWAESEKRWSDADSLFADALDRLSGDMAPSWVMDGPLAPASGRLLHLAAKRLAAQGDHRALDVVNRALELGFEGDDDGVTTEAAAHELKGDLLSKTGIQGRRLAETYLRAGECYYRSSLDKQAVSVLRRSIEIEPRFSDALWLLAEVLSWLGDDASAQEAATAWDLASSCGPPPSERSSSAFITKVRLNERLYGDAAPPSILWQSIAYLERAIPFADEDPLLWNYLASHHRNLGNESIGLAAANQALVLQPDSAWASEQRASLLADMGAYSAAEVAIDEILDRSNERWARATRAWLLLRTDRLDEAIKTLESVVREDTNTVWYRELLATCYQQAGDWEKAAQLNEWIYARRSDDQASDLTSYAWAALSMRKPAEAKQFFDRALVETSADPFDAISGSAFANFAIGDFETGERLLRQAIASATRRRQLDDFVAIDMPLIEHLQATWEQGSAALKFLRESIPDQIHIRRKCLPESPTPLEEIERVLERPRDRVPDHIGPLATHARLLAEDGQTDEAAVVYEQLLATGALPEARDALVRTHRLRAECDEELNEYSEAAVSYEHALRRAKTLDKPHESAKLYVRLALLCLVRLRESVRGCQFLREGLAALPDEPVDTSFAFYKMLSDRVTDRVTFRKVLAALRTVATSRTTERNLVVVARETVFWFVLNHYRDIDLCVQPDFRYRMTAQSVGIEGHPILLDEESDHLLNGHLPMMRERIEIEMGVKLPGALIRLSEDSEPWTYTLLIDEIPCANGTVDEVSGISSTADSIVRRREKGHRQIVQDLESLLHAHLADLLDIDDCIYRHFLGTGKDEWKLPRMSSMQADHNPSESVALRLRRLLTALLEEAVPAANHDAVRDVLATASALTETTKLTRIKLRDNLPGNRRGLLSLTLGADIQRELERTIHTDVCGREVLLLAPERTDAMLTAIRDELAGDPPEDFVLITKSDRLRPLVREITAMEFPVLAVLSTNEQSIESTQEQAIELVIPASRGQRGEWRSPGDTIYPETATAAYLEWLVQRFFRGLQVLLEFEGNTEDELETVYALGYNLFAWGRYPEARKIFVELTRFGSASHYWRALGAANQQIGDYSDAIRAYSTALDIDDQDIVSLVYRAECSLLSGNRATARADLELAVACTAESGLQWMQRAALLLQRMDTSNE